MPHVARLRFNVFKNCPNKNLNIQDGPRLVPKTSKYHIDHHVLHTPTNGATVEVTGGIPMI